MFRMKSGGILSPCSIISPFLGSFCPSRYNINRSPLNVVHAGLDLLLGDMKSVGEWTPTAVRSMISIAEDMYSASDSAINILNDLLQYEHMDAGTLRVNISRLGSHGVMYRHLQAGLGLEAVAPAVGGQDEVGFVYGQDQGPHI
jgi:hypothetical protein